MRRFLLALSLLALLIAGTTTYAYADQQVVTLSDSPSGVKLMGQDDLGVNLRMDLGAIELFDVTTKGGDFTLLTVPGFNRSHEIGEPDLPTASKMLSIPFGADLQVEVLNYETQEIDLKALGFENAIMPAQPSLSKSQNPEDVPFEFDQSLYQVNQFYSLPRADAEVLGTMRNIHLGFVVFSPFEYNPVEGRLTVCTSIEVRVHYLNPDWAQTEEINRKYYSPFFEPIYDEIINYQAPTTDKGDLVRYPVKYVIVSDRMFEAQLQPFIQWKTEKGFNVIVAYTDVIGSTTTAITNYLEGLYDSANPPSDPAPSFVLFVGDDQQIPAHQCSGHISDLYFCEYSEPADYYPEVYYGRFSAQTTALLQPQIDKTLEYEKYLMPDPSFLGEVTLVSGVDAGHAPTWGNGQINYGTTYYFNAAHGIDPNVWLYPASDAAGVAAAIIQTIQNGVGFYNYTAHGGHDGLSDPSFSNSDVATLTNAHKYPLLIGNCCLTVTFGDDYATPCFGEAWVQKANGGGFAYIGGTNSTYWDEDYWWGVGDEPVSANPVWHAANPGAYDGIFHDHGEPMTEHYVTNSGIIFAGNTAVSQSTSPRKQYYWEIYTLLGDPSVMTYMGVPTDNDYTLPATILITDNSMTVDAEPESYVGISRDGVLHGAGFIDSTGSATIAIDPFTTPGEIQVVITHQNRIPVIDTLMVIAPEGPYVIYDTHDINDIAGNNDGMIDISEDILMGLQLKNVGPDDALNVNATLSTADTYVTFTDDSEAFGTILGNNGTAYVADAIGFTVDPATPDGHKVTFEVTVTGDQRITWNSAFNVTVHAPTVSYVSLAVNDATGNGNGILDAGETAEVTITLQNDGSGSAGNITGLLSEFDTFVSINDNSGTFGTIAPNGGTADNSGDVFEVAADASCPQGYAMQFTLDITGDGGYSRSFIIDFTVGDRVAFFADDFSYDQGWTGLGGNGEWTIGPCTGGAGDDTNGGPDPSEDHSPTADNQVLGTDLTPGTGGDYDDNLVGTYWVYSPVIDCEDYTSIQLRFFRWLGMESSQYDTAYFDVYDGSTWVRLYQNGATFDDQAWTEQYYDLSEYANENQFFQMRFGIGGSDGSVAYCGWNLDDFEMKGYYNGNDYKVRVVPEVQSQYGPANDVASYSLLIRNRGAFFDQFDLTYVGDWGVTFWNEAGTDQITATDQIGSLDSGYIMVKVAIPDNTPLHEFDSSLVIVTSEGNPMASDTALMITYSAGVPALIPWFEPFPQSSLYMQRWFSNVGATVNTGGLLPPSSPYSLNLDGGIDTVTSQILNLEGQAGARISYYYERGGGEDPTETGDDLWVEYKNNVGVWTTLATYSGGDPTMTEFEYVNLAFPGDALYNGLQFRLRSTGSGANNDDWFIDDIMIDLPPQIEVNPTAISETLTAGDSATGEMTVSNVGEGSMFYNIDITYMMDAPPAFTKLENSGQVEAASRTYTPDYYAAEDAKGIDNPLVGQEVKFNAGGPDDYGYYWMDSDEAGGPAFNWVDVSATGTDIVSQLDDDNYIGPFDIGFDFPYYGNTYTQFYVGSNGIIGFASDGMASRNELPIPTTSAPNNILAWMWDDLDPTDADNPNGHVYYESDGGSLVIQFVDYSEYQAAAGDVITAEIILSDKGDVKFQYLSIAPGFDILNSAVGIENADGTDGLEVCYHTGYLHDNLAIQFSKPYEWLHFDSYAGNLLPGEADTLACLITTEEDLEAGMRTAEVKIASNDPNSFETTIPAELEVITEAPYVCGDANADGQINVSDAVYVINYVFVGGQAPNPIESGDTNCDAVVNVSDAVMIINFVFVSGNDPCDTNGDGVPDC